MNVEVRKDAGYWSVYVNGVRTVDRESFAVADRVADCLRDPDAHPFSESASVADSIRRHFADCDAPCICGAYDHPNGACLP